METTRLKYNLVFINLTWLLGVQMANIILKGSPLSQNIEYRVHLDLPRLWCWQMTSKSSPRVEDMPDFSYEALSSFSDGQVSKA